MNLLRGMPSWGQYLVVLTSPGYWALMAIKLSLHPLVWVYCKLTTSKP